MTTAAPQTKPDAPESHPPVPDAAEPAGLWPIRLRLPDAVVAAGPDACEDWFWAVAMANQECLWAMELNANRELELMPTFSYSERREFRMSFEVEAWNIGLDSPGMTTGPSAAYFLSNGALRSPDTAWTLNDNVAPPRTEPPRTWPFCPDFVAEIRSDSQSSIADLLSKMQEYMDSGARLGWLIDPIERTVRIYRAGVVEPELLANPETLDGEDVLPGFVFDVRRLIFDLVAVPDPAE